MNEIIEQLAERADLYADNYLQSKGEYHPDWHTVRDNKFAELIVKECASICEHRYTYMNKDMSEGAFEAMACHDSILEHFGIEEYFNRVLQKQVETTGIDYYCGCCGKPHYVGKDIEHDKECIWC